MQEAQSPYLQITSKKPINSPITVAVDLEGSAEGACQVEEDQTREHHFQVAVACRGEAVVEPASRDEEEPEVLSPSVQEGEAPWVSVRTAVVELGTVAEGHQVSVVQTAQAA